MRKLKWLTPLFVFSVGLLAATVCSLPPPTGHAIGMQFVCLDDTDGGVDAGDNGGADGGTDDSADGGNTSGDPSRVITPVSCSATSGQSSSDTVFKYAPGYTPDPNNVSRVQNTVNQMSRADKVAQMRGTWYGSAFAAQFNDIQRSLDTATIRGFRYRDASRGVNFAEDMSGVKPNAATENGESVGFSTVFPTSSARGASFDLDLEYAVGEAIGDEMQAAQETLLLAPCMNLLRNPLWGRAQETYGEDSFHLGRMASAMVVGVQEHIAANAKHFMAYDIENNREANNSVMDEQTLRETYGRHFRMVIQDGGVASVMASYNKVNGKKSTQNQHTLTDVLRTDFGFKGFVLSDWWAMPPGTTVNATDTSQLKANAVEAMTAGLDVELPWAGNYGQLENIINAGGGLTEDDLRVPVSRILEQKFRFNADNLNGNVGRTPTTRTYWSNNRISCDATHLKLAQKAAVESMVLLKNDAGTLPISGATSIAVVGATVPYITNNGGSINTGGIVNFATDVRTGDLGSSRVFGDPAKSTGPFAGICAGVGGTVSKDGKTCEGSPSIPVTTATNKLTFDSKGKVTANDLSPALAAAQNADFVIVMAGLTAQDEGEEYTQARDRTTLALDGKQDAPLRTVQNDLINMVAAMGKPMVVVLEGGAVIDMPWLSNVPAVVMAWYPGMKGGAALAQLLFGSANFSAKLPVTWAKNLADYGLFDGGGDTTFDYFAGYRRFDQMSIPPLFAFGYGLSYTKFEYRKLQVGCTDLNQGGVLPLYVNVANTGGVAGDEIAMVFVSFPDSTAQRRSVKELKGFARVHLEPGEEKQIVIPVRISDLDYFKQDSPTGTTGKWVVESGNIKVMVGGSSDNLPLSATVKVNGY